MKRRMFTLLLAVCMLLTAVPSASALRAGSRTEETASSVSFADVKDGDWFAQAVNYAVSNGLMNGMGGNKFEPNTGMTRAMLVTVLWRYSGSPVEGENTFTDLKQDWYIPAVTWAAHNGIVGGVGNGKFDPDANVTREQMAAILFRYSNKIGLDTSARVDLNVFPDAGKTSPYAQEALSWAVAMGLITGSKEGSRNYLAPIGNATRAQVATILMRYIEGRDKAPQVNFLGVMDAYSDTRNRNGTFCCYHIPKAVFSGTGTLAINEKIFSELYYILEQELYCDENYYELARLIYDWGQKDDVVSIYATTSWLTHYHVTYRIYNINAKTGAELSKADTLALLNFTQESYQAALKDTINGYYTDYLREHGKDLSDSLKNDLNDCWAQALATANLDNTVPFVGSNGHLCAYAYVYLPFGSEVYSLLFDLVTCDSIEMTCPQHG